jgi:hypothetical protein
MKCRGYGGFFVLLLKYRSHLLVTNPLNVIRINYFESCIYKYIQLHFFYFIFKFNKGDQKCVLENHKFLIRSHCVTSYSITHSKMGKTNIPHRWCSVCWHTWCYRQVMPKLSFHSHVFLPCKEPIQDCTENHLEGTRYPEVTKTHRLLQRLGCRSFVLH